jgi:hypothetical protein
VKQIAILQWDHLETTLIKDSEMSYNTIQTKVFRLKTSTTKFAADKVIHFCHVSKFFKCYFFVMFFQLVIDRSMEPSIFMFPSWEKYVKRDGQSESKVSNYFRDSWKTISNLAQDYVAQLKEKECDKSLETIHEFCIDTISSVRGSHSGKKKGVQDLGDSCLPPQVRTCL